MDILVTYDVNTETREGRRRLRTVAKLCQALGQRVQHSVFECRVNDMQYEAFRDKLLKVISADSDSIRLYKLRQPREQSVESYGIDRYVDFDDPLIV
jgi:CRISPR-associated protein Cas2